MGPKEPVCEPRQPKAGIIGRGRGPNQTNQQLYRPYQSGSPGSSGFSKVRKEPVEPDEPGISARNSSAGSPGSSGSLKFPRSLSRGMRISAVWGNPWFPRFSRIHSTLWRWNMPLSLRPEHRVCCSRTPEKQVHHNIPVVWVTSSIHCPR